MDEALRKQARKLVDINFDKGIEAYVAHMKAIAEAEETFKTYSEAVKNLQVFYKALGRDYSIEEISAAILADAEDEYNKQKEEDGWM